MHEGKEVRVGRKEGERIHVLTDVAPSYGHTLLLTTIPVAMATQYMFYTTIKHHS